MVVCSMHEMDRDMIVLSRTAAAHGHLDYEVSTADTHGYLDKESSILLGHPNIQQLMPQITVISTAMI